MPKKPAISTLADNPPAWKGAMDQFDWTDTETGTLRPADCFSTSNYPLSLEAIFCLSLGEDT
jgi:hypothetical protein